MLKLVPNKFFGISLQFILLFVFILWPFLDVHKEKNIFKRPVLRGVFIFLMISCVILMWWGRR
jgi:quinol-cytochrome oxidoreductase complex cytochrome b subunit